MTWKKANISNPGTSTQFGADDMDKVSNLFSAVDVDDVDIAADWKFRSSKKKLMNPGNTFGYTEVGSAITGNRNVTEPLLTGNDTRVYEAHQQTLTKKAIDILDNTLSLRSNSALVTKNGSTYYAIKRDGTIISSGSVFETVAQAAIDEEACDVVIGGVSNTTEFLFSSTGLVLDDQNTMFLVSNFVHQRIMYIIITNITTTNISAFASRVLLESKKRLKTVFCLYKRLCR